MGFWFTFLFWLGTQVVSALLFRPKTENARPSGLDEFQVPTATEGRAIPIVVGKVKIAGPNVVWYGDLSTRAITEEVGGFLGIGGKDVTKGYEYRIGVQMVLASGPIDGIDRVWMGDKVIASGETSSNIVVSDPGFFGGEDAGGGIEFTLELELGGQVAANSYIASQQSPAPAYVRTAYVVLTDGSGGPGYIGNRASLSNLAFEPFWYPNTLAVTGGKERIGDDANPICFLYELLVANDDWGIQFSAGDVLITGTAAAGALRALAEQVYDENLGFSMVIDRQTEVREIIQEIERHVDGAFRLDLTDGRFKIILARPPAGTPVNLNESNVTELVNYARGNWQETKNEIRIGYADRAKDYGSTFQPDYDNANRQITNRRAIATLNFPGIKTASTANIVAAREIVSVAHPLAKATVRVQRELYALQRGDPVTLTWPDLGITDLPMRITRPRYGTDRRGEITLDLVEDVFRLESTGFADVPGTLWTAPQTAPANPTAARIWEPPRQLSAGDRKVAILVARAGGLQLSYDVYVDYDGGTDAFVLSNAGIDSWTPVAALQGAITADLDGPPHYTQNITIDGLADITLGDLIDAASTDIDSADPRNVLLVDDEVIWFETAADAGSGAVTLGNCHRGAFGTVPADHADDARVWFPSQGAGLLQPDAFPSSVSVIRARVTPSTAIGTLALASANNIPAASDYVIQGTAPYAPGDAQVNGERFVDDDWTRTPGILRTTWKTRNGTSQALDTLQDDAGIGQPSTVGITARVRRVDTDAIAQEATFIQGGEFNGAGFIPQTTPGAPDELDFYLQVFASGSGVDSQIWESQPFEVFGFGLDFGGDFGGQDTGGANTGVVLAQGDAPDIIETAPTEPGLERTYTIDVTGATPVLTQTTNTGIRLLFSAFDRSADEFVNFQFYLNAQAGETLTELATRIADQVAASLTGRPFTVSRTGTRVSVSTASGSLTLRVTNLQAEQKIGSAGVTQAAVGAQSAIQQAGWLDYYTTEIQDSQVVEVLAPDRDAAYQNSGLIVAKFLLVGLTHERQQELDAEASLGGVVQVTESSLNTTDSRSLEFQDIVSKLNAHPDSRWFTASVGRTTGLTNPQTRDAIAIQCEEGIDLLETFAISSTTGQPSGFFLVTKRGRDALPAGPLPQVVEFGFTVSTAVDHSSVELEAVLGGTVFSRTVASPGGTTEIIAAVEALAGDIDASGSYSASVRAVREFSRTITVIGAAGVSFEAFFAATYGPRIEFRETT